MHRYYCFADMWQLHISPTHKTWGLYMEWLGGIKPLPSGLHPNMVVDKLAY